MTDDPEEKRKEYLSERKLLMDWELSATTSFDKAMLTLSGGALALSLTYLKEIGGASAFGWALKGSWILFGLALLSTTWSFMFSQYGLRRQREILEANKNSKNPSGDEQSGRNRWTCPIICLNWLSLISFTLGAISLLRYAVSVM